MNSHCEIHGSKWQTVLAVLAACGLTLGVLVLSVVMGVTTYRSTLEAAKQNARFVSSLLAGQMGMVLLDSESDLHAIGRLLQILPDVRLHDHRQRLREMLDDIQHKRPYVRRLLITDPQGRITDWTGRGEPPEVGHLDYIQAHRLAEREAFVGSPLANSRHARDWVFGVSLGQRDHKGELTHIVAAVISLDLLLEVFQGQGIPPGVGIMVTNQEGQIYISAPGQEYFAGSTVPGLKDYVEHGAQGSTFVGRSPVGEGELVAGSTLVSRSPLLAFAAFRLDQILAPWRQHALVYGGASIALLLVVTALSVLLVRGQIRLNRQGQQLALSAATDMLTGALNRRSFMAAAKRECARMARYGGEVACVMLDLDYFKAVNDTYGHAAGDLALSSAARFISSRLREPDLLCRYGGEEFVLLLPGTGQAQAATVAEALRLGVEGLSLESEGQHFSVTASFGVAGVLRDDASVEDAIARADQALYRAKEEGRNRVCQAPSPSGLACSPVTVG